MPLSYRLKRHPLVHTRCTQSCTIIVYTLKIFRDTADNWWQNIFWSAWTSELAWYTSLNLCLRNRLANNRYGSCIRRHFYMIGRGKGGITKTWVSRGGALYFLLYLFQLQKKWITGMDDLWRFSTFQHIPQTASCPGRSSVIKLKLLAGNRVPCISAYRSICRYIGLLFQGLHSSIRQDRNINLLGI